MRELFPMGGHSPYAQGRHLETKPPRPMHLIVPIAAAGYSLVYLLAGGGFGGAVIIFIVAKMLGK